MPVVFFLIEGDITYYADKCMKLPIQVVGFSEIKRKYSSIKKNDHACLQTFITS